MSIRAEVLALKVSSKLGWAIEANWADPFVFAIYSIVRPIFSTLILVFMYKVIMGGNTSTELFAFIYLGNVFFMYVTNLLAGIGMVIHDDREQYEMLKYIYLTPINKYFYLFGRSVPKLVLTTFSVVITVVFGILIFRLNIDWSNVNWGLFLLAFPIGIFATTCLGIILAGACLNTARHGYAFTEGTAGVFYLAIGAVFPIDVLPHWVQQLSQAVPLTYWLELLRRALGTKSVSRVLEHYSNEQLLMIMILTGIGLALTSHFFYRWMEHEARKRGKFDQRFNY